MLEKMTEGAINPSCNLRDGEKLKIGFCDVDLCQRPMLHSTARAYRNGGFVCGFRIEPNTAIIKCVWRLRKSQHASIQLQGTRAVHCRESQQQSVPGCRSKTVASETSVSSHTLRGPRVSTPSEKQGASNVISRGPRVPLLKSMPKL